MRLACKLLAIHAYRAGLKGSALADSRPALHAAVSRAVQDVARQRERGRGAQAPATPVDAVKPAPPGAP